MSRRVASGIIWIFGLPAEAAPAARRTRGTEVGPLAQVGFSQNHCARTAQSRYQKSVIGGAVRGQRQRAGSRMHAITGIDIGFEHDGDPMQWPSWPRRSALPIEAGGDFHRIGIDFDDRSQFWTGVIDAGDLRQVVTNDVLRFEIAVSHRSLQCGDVIFT